MFIPIDAKADVQGSKKGKLTPAQHAQLNAWCLASKTGILDCLGRCEAETLNYAPVNNIATVTFKNGYVVICGRLVECETGTQVQVTTPASGTVTGKIILKYNLLGAGQQEFIVTTKTTDLVQQDLNENPQTGVYEFELYSYTATPTSLTLTRNNTEYVPDIGGKLDNKLEEFEKSLYDEGKPLNGYNNEKGTIEERLERLGFKSGSITPSMGSATENTIKRQGNYCIASLNLNVNNYKIPNNTGVFNLGTIPESFRPKKSTLFLCEVVTSSYTTDIGNIHDVCSARIHTGGRIEVYIENLVPLNYMKFVKLFNIGYEAQPL